MGGGIGIDSRHQVLLDVFNQLGRRLADEKRHRHREFSLGCRLEARGDEFSIQHLLLRVGRKADLGQQFFSIWQSRCWQSPRTNEQCCHRSDDASHGFLPIKGLEKRLAIWKERTDEYGKANSRCDAYAPSLFAAIG